jgi:hypothetical protein
MLSKYFIIIFLKDFAMTTIFKGFDFFCQKIYKILTSIIDKKKKLECKLERNF